MNRWEINHGFFIEPIGNLRIFRLKYYQSEIVFAFEDIDDMIEALKRARAHFAAEDLKEEEREKLAAWGKEKIKCEG